jgi:hypothetical protein
MHGNVSLAWRTLSRAANCNPDAAGVRVAPTFQLYKKSEKVGEMTGAKIEELQKLIDENK